MDLKELKDKVREFKKIHCMPLNKPKPGSKHYTEALGKMTPKQYLQHIINDILPKHGDHPKEVKMVMKEPKMVMKEVKEVKKGGNVWIRFLNEHESEKRDGEDRKDFLKRMAVVYHGMKGKPEKKVKKEEKKEKVEKKEEKKEKKPEKKSKTEEAMVAREKMLKEAGFDTDFKQKKAKKAKKAKRASSPKSPKAKKIKEAKKHIEKAKEVLKNA